MRRSTVMLNLFQHPFGGHAMRMKWALKQVQGDDLRVFAALREAKLLAASAAGLMLAACAAQQQSDAVAAGAPGFWLGLWHGFIFPVAWIVSLFVPDVAIYAVPNNGGWYDFGYFVGIVFLGVGARKTRTVYKDRIINIRARRIN